MTKALRIEVDVRAFAPVSAIDTCSIWNLLSSKRLLAAARARQRWFLVADYVRYEALVQPRTRPTNGELALQADFRSKLEQQNGFDLAPMSVSDLQAVANLPEVRRLGRGEIAAMALARKMRVGFVSDDQGARKAAPSVGAEPAQTIPHLFGWLLYDGQLSDGDVPVVIAEHEANIAENRGRLSTFLTATYHEACRCRLLRSVPSSPAVNDVSISERPGGAIVAPASTMRK